MSLPIKHFTDDFEDGSASDWTSAVSTLTVTEGLAHASGASTQAWPTASTNQPSDVNQSVTAAIVWQIASPAGEYFSLFLRLDDGVTSGDFTPDNGYEMRMFIKSAGVRQVDIFGWRNNATRQIATLADASSSTLKINSTDIGVLQDIQFTAVDDGNSVQFSVFINGGDPVLSHTERGQADTPNRLYTTKGPGLWGLGFSDPEIYCDHFEAQDKYIVPADGPMVGRTLSEIRASVNLRASRGGTSTLSAAYVNELVGMAQDEVLNEIGDLNIFMEKEVSLQLTSLDDDRTYEMPTYVDRIISLMRSPSRRPIDWRFIGYNNKNTAIRFASGENLSGETVIVRYRETIPELNSDTDRSVIPRRFDEVLVLAAVIKVAERAGDMKWLETLYTQRERAMNRMRSLINVVNRQRYQKLRVRRTRQRSLRSDARYVSDPYDLR